MVKLITLAKKFDTEDFEIVMQPSRTVKQHRAAVKEVRRTRSHPEYEEVWVCKPVRKLRLKRGPGSGSAFAPTEEKPVKTFKTVAEAAIARLKSAVTPAVPGEPKPSVSTAFQRQLQKQEKAIQKKEQTKAPAPKPAAKPGPASTEPTQTPPEEKKGDA